MDDPAKLEDFDSGWDGPPDETEKVVNKTMEMLSEEIERVESALEELANKVVNLANKLEEHLKEPDAHNPGTVRKK